MLIAAHHVTPHPYAIPGQRGHITSAYSETPLRMVLLYWKWFGLEHPVVQYTLIWD